MSAHAVRFLRAGCEMLGALFQLLGGVKGADWPPSGRGQSSPASCLTYLCLRHDQNCGDNERGPEAKYDPAPGEAPAVPIQSMIS